MKKYFLVIAVVFMACKESNKQEQFDYIHNKFYESEAGWTRNYNNLDSMFFYSGKMHAYYEMEYNLINK